MKTVRFGRFTYVGDPCNTVRIFNELEVDELLFLDITATREGRTPNFRVLRDIADECFMPLGYGGGVTNLEIASSVFDIGFEKVAVNTAAVCEPKLIRILAERWGSQAVIASIDVKKDIFGRSRVVIAGGTRRTSLDPVAWAKTVEAEGAGEILLTSVDREGTWRGFDLDLVRSVADAVHIPVIAHGGGGNVRHIGEAVNQAGASAVALGSMVVFQKQGMGVLVNFPDEAALTTALHLESA